MAKLRFLVLLTALLAVAGCGGGDDGSSAATAGAPAELLLGMEDLPEGSTVGETPPELCGPLPVLERDTDRLAISKTFVVGNARIIEAVGAFRTPEQAASAYERLNDPERLECIRNAIASFGASPSVELQEPEDVDFGDEGTRVRYLITDSKRQGYTDVISLRTGACTASLLVAIEGEDPEDEATERASERAAEALDDDCG